MDDLGQWFQFARDIGLLGAALVYVVRWKQSDDTETRKDQRTQIAGQESRILELEKFERETLITLVRDTTKVLDRCAATIENTAKVNERLTASVAGLQAPATGEGSPRPGSADEPGSGDA